MKKFQLALLTAFLMLGIYSSMRAQGWNQDKMGIYSIGVGGTQALAFGPGFAGLTGPGLSINLSGEYKVHRFVGLGFETGMNIYAGPYYVFEGVRVRPRYPSLGFPVAMKANVHILEAAGVPIADRLDVYAGLNLGAGPGFYTAPGGGAFGFIQTGPQVGVRYWLSKNIAVFGEFGWGATFANAGITL